jgi:hypothetical protein
MTEGEYKYAWNYQMNGAFIEGRTIHKIKSREGREVETDCGRTIYTEHKHITNSVENVQERYKCGNCNWEDNVRV